MEDFKQRSDPANVLTGSLSLLVREQTLRGEGRSKEVSQRATTAAQSSRVE